MAHLRDPSEPLLNTLPFSLPSPQQSNTQSTPPITEITEQPSMNLLHTPNILLSQLVSAIEFMRHSRSANAQLFICVFRSLEQTNAHTHSDNTDATQFAERIKTEALTHFPTLFPSELP